MPLKLNWYIENHVILLVHEGECSDQDLFDVDQPMINYMNQSTASLVHLIIDNTEGKYTPSFKAITALEWPKHPRYGWAIFVGLTNPLQRFAAVLASNFFKVRQRNVNTLDEALNFLNNVDSTLPTLHDTKLDKAS